MSTLSPSALNKNEAFSGILIQDKKSKVLYKLSLLKFNNIRN